MINDKLYLLIRYFINWYLYLSLELIERKIVTNRKLKYHNSSLRGAHPFERMKADKKDSILFQTAKYARRLDNG